MPGYTGQDHENKLSGHPDTWENRAAKVEKEIRNPDGLVNSTQKQFSAQTTTKFIIREVPTTLRLERQDSLQKSPQKL